MAKVNFTVVSLTLVTTAGLLAITRVEGTDLYSSVFLAQSSIEKTMSSALNGLPSDHFMPGRRVKVNSVELALTSHLDATQGSTSVNARFQRTRPWLPTMRKMPLWSELPRRPRRRAPP